MAVSDFPPKAVRAIVQDVASLLKERKETVSVAETVRITICSRPPLTGDLETSMSNNSHKYATGCWRHYISFVIEYPGSQWLLQRGINGEKITPRCKFSAG